MLAADDPLEISVEDLNREVLAYRQARAERLTSPRGWLTVIGKVWISPGVHRIGAAPGSEILLPGDRAPARVGSVTRAGKGVRLVVDSAVEAFARGQRVTSLDLRSDADQEPDDVTIGSLTLQLLRRGDDLAIRVRDGDSPLRRSFTGIPAYPVAPAWRIVARFEPFADEQSVITEDSDGRPQSNSAPGFAVFEKDGVACRLTPVFESDRKRLFVLFSDPTNHDETYQAGRFLYVPLPDRGRVVLDFNKAFNPPCAFTPHAACPLPPAENSLSVRVEAGEKRPLPSAG